MCDLYYNGYVEDWERGYYMDEKEYEELHAPCDGASDTDVDFDWEALER